MTRSIGISPPPRQIHPNPPGRKTDPLLLIHHRDARVIPFEERSVGALRARVRRELFGFLDARVWHCFRLRFCFCRRLGLTRRGGGGGGGGRWRAEHVPQTLVQRRRRDGQEAGFVTPRQLAEERAVGGSGLGGCHGGFFWLLVWFWVKLLLQGLSGRCRLLSQHVTTGLLQTDYNNF